MALAGVRSDVTFNYANLLHSRSKRIREYPKINHAKLWYGWGNPAPTNDMINKLQIYDWDIFYLKVSNDIFAEILDKLD